MMREEALAILRKQAPMLKDRFGVKRVGLFGSIARGEGNAESDVDVVVEFDVDLLLDMTT